MKKGKIKVGTKVRVIVPLERFQSLPDGYVIPCTDPKKYTYEVEFPNLEPPEYLAALGVGPVTYYFHEGEIVPVADTPTSEPYSMEVDA